MSVTDSRMDFCHHAVVGQQVTLCDDHVIHVHVVNSQSCNSTRLHITSPGRVRRCLTGYDPAIVHVPAGGGARGRSKPVNPEVKINHLPATITERSVPECVVRHTRRRQNGAIRKNCKWKIRRKHLFCCMCTFELFTNIEATFRNVAFCNTGLESNLIWNRYNVFLESCSTPDCS